MSCVGDRFFGSQGTCLPLPLDRDAQCRVISAVDQCSLISAA